jgi:diguanylate cyclase (GGDEF)-like protein/PAS domain S-box-containing protein
MRARYRVLLIEDNPGDRRLVRELLAEQRSQFEITEAARLDDAWRHLRGREFDVLLLDLSLPDAEGVATVRHCQAVTPSVAIVVLTGLDDAQIGAAALQCGAQDYLVKGQIDGRLLDRSIRYAVERKRMLAQLRVSEERYALAARATNEGLWDWDLRNDSVYYSARWREMMGISGDEEPSALVDWLDRVHPVDQEAVRLALDAHIEGLTPVVEHEYRILHEDGSHRWMLCRALAVRDTDGNAYRMAGSQADITQQKFHDPLTGLPNRSLLSDRLERAIGRALARAQYRFAVLFVDLDDFQVVNQRLGEVVANELLAEVAERLRECLRGGDTLARLIADEFVILQEDIEGVTDSRRLVDRIALGLTRPFHVAGRELVITASIGIALSGSNYRRPEEILRDAEIAMNRAKASGKGHAVFDRAMHERASAEFQLELDLRSAIERKEFVVHFQPVLRIADRSIAGFEALVRWERPGQGLVAPGAFIPAAEQSNLILPIGRMVLELALKQLKHLEPNLAPSSWVAVNLSPKQFFESDLVPYLSEVTKQIGVSPSQVKLEITEGVILEDAAAVAAMLRELKALGFRTALDDFGTGYSSLTHLHQLPIDSLKIDRSFVTRLDHQGGGREIVRAIVTLAHNLAMDVVAEGVETQAQLDELAALDCDAVQGFLFSEPLAPQDVDALVARRSR